MNANLAKRVKIFGFQIVAEMVENQIQEMNGDAGGKKNGPELSRKID